MAEKKKDIRVRNFATVVYPESAPDMWEEILKDYHIQGFISPLHDKDVSADGTPKKPHYHVMLMFEGKKSDDQVKEIFDSIGGVGLLHIESIRGYARYLIHIDDPNKAQYSEDDVISICGADYYGICSLAIDKYRVIGEIINFIQEKQISSYRQLLLYCRDNRYDWFRIVIDSPYVIRSSLVKKDEDK